MFRPPSAAAAAAAAARASPLRPCRADGPVGRIVVVTAAAAAAAVTALPWKRTLAWPTPPRPAPLSSSLHAVGRVNETFLIRQHQVYWTLSHVVKCNELMRREVVMLTARRIAVDAEAFNRLWLATLETVTAARLPPPRALQQPQCPLEPAQEVCPAPRPFVSLPKPISYRFLAERIYALMWSIQKGFWKRQVLESLPSAWSFPAMPARLRERGGETRSRLTQSCRRRPAAARVSSGGHAKKFCPLIVHSCLFRAFRTGSGDTNYALVLDLLNMGIAVFMRLSRVVAISTRINISGSSFGSTEWHLELPLILIIHEENLVIISDVVSTQGLPNLLHQGCGIGMEGLHVEVALSARLATTIFFLTFGALRGKSLKLLQQRFRVFDCQNNHYPAGWQHWAASRPEPVPTVPFTSPPISTTRRTKVVNTHRAGGIILQVVLEMNILEGSYAGSSSKYLYSLLCKLVERKPKGSWVFVFGMPHLYIQYFFPGRCCVSTLQKATVFTLKTFVYFVASLTTALFLFITSHVPEVWYGSSCAPRNLADALSTQRASGTGILTSKLASVENLARFRECEPKGTRLRSGNCAVKSVDSPVPPTTS
ncbi:Protein of unknown function [Gryllus bimaculatus]|nr:Protein of unknown function [Gryllus bimaculatus]